jgi:hypothetical protein
MWECEICSLATDDALLVFADERITRDLTCEERATFLNAPPCP